MQELLRLYLTAAATQGVRCQTTGAGLDQKGKAITVAVGRQYILVDKEIGFVRIYLKPHVQHRDLQVLQRLSHRSYKMAYRSNARLAHGSSKCTTAKRLASSTTRSYRGLVGSNLLASQSM